MADPSSKPASSRPSRSPGTGPQSIRRVQTGPLPEFVYNPPPGDPPMIHAEEGFVVVDKPAGLLAVPGIAEGKDDCVRSRAAAMFPHATGPMTCHRLDLSTSGVMILALDPKTHSELSKQFEFRKTRKRYVALVEGHLDRDEGEIHAPMRKDMEVRPLMLVDYVEGKPSKTRFRVLSREMWEGRPVTRVQMEPFTGRTHQLRVHAAHPRITTVGNPPAPGPDHTPGLGAPIVGDELYGGWPAPRLMLHASMLTIFHPITGRSLTFRAKDPF